MLSDSIEKIEYSSLYQQGSTLTLFHFTYVKITFTDQQFSFRYLNSVTIEIKM